MQINPGGRLNIEDVIGRDHEIDRYWRMLERQGLVLSAERRIGKTHVLLKMSEECRPGYLPVCLDLEAVHSIADLIRSIYAAADRSLRTLPGVKARLAKWSSLLPKKIPVWTSRRPIRPGLFRSPTHSTTSQASLVARAYSCFWTSSH
ncbi:MAG: hypothetical protein OXH09_07950 [Gammaproteobacteria bacterium]|nr:hypothetical protein [Gammaproteobacteria bacterium]